MVCSCMSNGETNWFCDCSILYKRDYWFTKSMCDRLSCECCFIILFIIHCLSSSGHYRFFDTCDASRWGRSSRQYSFSGCQFNAPHGFCLGIDEEIIVADTNNHRIEIFDKMGEYKYQFGIPGREAGQLWYPRKVAVIRSTGKFVVCEKRK